MTDLEHIYKHLTAKKNTDTGEILQIKKGKPASFTNVENFTFLTIKREDSQYFLHCIHCISCISFAFIHLEQVCSLPFCLQISGLDYMAKTEHYCSYTDKALISFAVCTVVDTTSFQIIFTTKINVFLKIGKNTHWEQF